MTDCIFCRIVAGDAPSHRIYEDEHAVAFLDVNPATEGHALVVPREHASDLWEIGEDGARHVMTASVRVAKLLRSMLEPDGLNLIQANGTAGFQTVFHLHVHVVPRYAGDGIVMPWTPRPGDPDALRRTAARIRDELSPP